MASSQLDPRPRTPTNTQVNLSKCLCHKEGTAGKMTQFTVISWQTFHRAAKERDDEIYNLLKDR